MKFYNDTDIFVFLNEEYADFEGNEIESIESNIEDDFDYLFNFYEEKEEDYNHLVDFYDENLESFEFDSLIKDYEDYMNQIDSFIDDNQYREDNIESFIEDYEDEGEIFDLIIAKYEQERQEELDYYADEYKNQISPDDVEEKYYDHIESLDEMHYNNYEESIESKFEAYQSSPINNHIDYGNMHEIDNFSDYLDYKDMDTIDFALSQADSYNEIDLSPEWDILDNDGPEYDEHFFIEDFDDCEDIVVDYLENILPSDAELETLIEDDPYDSLENLISFDEEVNSNIEGEIDFLISNKLEEMERYEYEVDSYLESLLEDKEAIHNSIEAYLDREEYREYDEYYQFNDLELEEIENQGIDFDDLNNLDGTANIYFNREDEDEEPFDLNEDIYYGDYQYDE